MFGYEACFSGYLCSKMRKCSYQFLFPKAQMEALSARLTLAVAGAILGMAVFVFFAHEVYEGETRAIDGTIYQYFRMHHTFVLDAVMSRLSILASGSMLMLIVLLCLLCFWLLPAARPHAVSLLLAVGGGELLVNGLKIVFHRARPSPVFAHLGYSFPSGHAFFAVTVYGLLAYWLTRTGRGCVCWLFAVALIALVGFSRIYLGVHYASDVLAGFAVGVPWAWACLVLPNALRRTQTRVSLRRRTL